MIYYSIKKVQGIGRFLNLEARFEVEGEKDLILQLASWRPGRYELGNFSKNIRNWSITDEKGVKLIFRKITKDRWVIETHQAKVIIVRYEYFAGELNAGSSYADDTMIYFNPVNCFLFNPDKMDSPYRIELDIPQEWKVATSLKEVSKHVLYAANFEELADSPVIASGDVKHLSYEVRGVTFHVWLQGCFPRSLDELLNDFKRFTESQINLFGSFPVDSYHFLFHLPPYFIRHGVEHCASTVIAMGPFSELIGQSLYKDLIGISSHELFHTWNVKSIRPVEMMPYDYTRENYNCLGYVTEGVTTYYGDLIPWQCGLFDEQDFMNIISERVNEYLANPGRFSMSVAESSWDTWLDGYSAGVYGRKVSIYNEGCLLALICDLIIIECTSGTKSMDDCMRVLFERFGKTSIGYSEDQYWQILEEVSGINLDSVRNDLANGTQDYLPWIQKVLGFVGWTCQLTPSSKYTERTFGFTVEESAGKTVIGQVIDYSPAAMAGLLAGDEITSVNGYSVYKNLQHLLLSLGNEEIHLRGVRRGSFCDVHLIADGKVYRYEASLKRTEQPDLLQTKLFNFWKTRSN